MICILITQKDGSTTELVASLTEDITVKQHPEIPTTDLSFEAETGERIVLRFDKQLLTEVE